MTSLVHPGSGAMFDGIARRYDALNRITSLGLDQMWRKRVAARVARAGARDVLDVATGTGDLALAILAAAPATRVVGLDPSQAMLHVAESKRGSHGPRLELVHGDGTALPFADRTFDAVTYAFGIRNVNDRPAALVEARRVLRPGGSLLILELSEPKRGWLAALARVHIHHVVPWMGARLSGASEYAYLSRSIAAFPEPDAFRRTMEGAGFARCTATPFTLGVVTLYEGKAP